jgi:inactivated superfamily I helicase
MTALLFGLILAAPPTPADEVALELGVPPLAVYEEKLIKIYRTDDVTAEAVAAAPGKYPVRTAVAAAAVELAASYKVKFKLELYEPKLDAAKKDIIEVQEDIASCILKLKEQYEILLKAAESRNAEPSQRWQAHLDYQLAMTRLRVAYLEELNLAYGTVHRNELPKLDAAQNQTGWTATPAVKMHSKRDVRRLDEDARADLETVKDKYPGSPWAKLAERELAVLPGLDWKAGEVKPPAPPKPDAKKKKP